MIQNVFACLVHENQKCIIDLVRNLNYYDPDSVVLLYNGGNDKELFRGLDSAHIKAIIHPDPTPQKYGYIYGFAFDCISFCVNHLEFDTMTIVDSDQLLIRKGYSQYLDAAIEESTGKVGLYSYDERRVSQENTENYVAGQAIREFDLWEPFIRKFEYGMDAFVHWTFWPTTIFSHQAAKEIQNLFDEDSQLRNVISQSSVWALEEVLFPTLCKLLGYEVRAHPCKQELVKFRKEFKNDEFEQGLSDPRNFWIHPVERKMNNPIRKRIKEMSYNYNSHLIDEVTAGIRIMFDFSFVKLLDKVEKIEGWLSRMEADLLIAATLKACIDLPLVHAMVEIGSYHGKSTVLIGSILKYFNQHSKIYAIDPHNGVVGDRDIKILTLPPSLTAFKRNIQDEKLGDHVELIQDFSFNVKWNRNISLLFIDGLHDYNNVSRDFQSFAKYVEKGGYIVFHDYADYYPGVKKFVNENMNKGILEKVSVADSLIVLKKTSIIQSL